MANNVPQRVVTSLSPPPANNMSAESPPHKRQNMEPDRPVPKAKKARSNTERVEGTALEMHWSPGEMDIPPDEKWKLMGPEWLSNLKKARVGKRMHSSIKTKGRMLGYVMQGPVPTEKAGQTMWKLSHCRDPFDVLIRTIGTLSVRGNAELTEKVDSIAWLPYTDVEH